MHHRALPTLLACILVLALLGLGRPALAAGEARYALVVGNSAYKTAPLKNPAKDAQDMAALLKALGFHVTLKVDAGLKDMEEAVRTFG